MSLLAPRWVPEALRTAYDTVLGPRPLGVWVLALATFVGCVVLGRLLVGVVCRRLSRVADRTETSVDDTLVDALSATRPWFYGALGLRFAAEILVLEGPIQSAVLGLTLFAVLVQIGLWINAVLQAGVEGWVESDEEQRPRRRTAAGGIVLTARIVTWTVLLLVLLQNVGVEITGLLTGLGIGGVAAALAVQNVLGDLFASLSIYFDRPFDVGDFVVVGEYMGEVDRIGWRSSRLRGLGGELLVLANADLAQSRVRNFRRMSRRRVVTRVGLVYDTSYASLEATPKLLRDAVESVDGLTFDRAHFQGYGASSLDFELVWYVEDRDFNRHMDLQQEVLLGIHQRFEAAGLTFAFPTQTLDFAGPVPLAYGDDFPAATAP
ncbi:MAG: mechanosensitive ion channel domain-containing protein [Myxococcota bacterium]